MKSLFASCALLVLATLSANQPNVIFIAVDDMNDWIGGFDTDIQAKTPNLDRLAAEGVSFLNAHTPGTYCAPARSAIFSGQFASTTGCYEYQLYHVWHPELDPLQVSFQKGGYNTYGTGKLFNHGEGCVDLRGWTEFRVRTQEQREAGWPMDTWGHGAPLPPQGEKTKENRTAYGPRDLRKWGALKNEEEAEMADTIRTEWAIAKLQEKHDKPFFIGLGLYAPHIPNYAPQKYYDMYDRETLKVPELNPEDLEDLPEPIKSKMQRRAASFQRNYIDSGLHKEAVHSYLACVSYADAMLGRVLDALDDSPYADNTIVVFWSDHGYHYGEKGHIGKKELWQRTSNVPFIWRGPDIAKGGTSNVGVSLIDMYPTFIDSCGLPESSHDLDGESLAALLKDPSIQQDRFAYLPYTEPNAYAMINDEWRYIKYSNDSEELYNIQNDREELNNLAGNPEYRELMDSIRARAPSEFAEPKPSLRWKKHLVIDGESFRWNKED